MTITSYSSRAHSRKGSFALAAILIGIAAIAVVFAYSRGVSLRITLRSLKSETKAAAIANTDLKNKLYRLLDFTDPDNLAGELGLIKEQKPRFISGI